MRVLIWKLYQIVIYDCTTTSVVDLRSYLSGSVVRKSLWLNCCYICYWHRVQLCFGSLQLCPLFLVKRNGINKEGFHCMELNWGLKEKETSVCSTLFTLYVSYKTENTLMGYMKKKNVLNLTITFTVLNLPILSNCLSLVPSLREIVVSKTLWHLSPTVSNRVNIFTKNRYRKGCSSLFSLRT